MSPANVRVYRFLWHFFASVIGSSHDIECENRMCHFVYIHVVYKGSPWDSWLCISFCSINHVAKSNPHAARMMRFLSQGESSSSIDTTELVSTEKQPFEATDQTQSLNSTVAQKEVRQKEVAQKKVAICKPLEFLVDVYQRLGSNTGIGKE